MRSASLNAQSNSNVSQSLPQKNYKFTKERAPKQYPFSMHFYKWDFAREENYKKHKIFMAFQRQKNDAARKQIKRLINANKKLTEKVRTLKKEKKRAAEKQFEVYILCNEQIPDYLQIRLPNLFFTNVIGFRQNDFSFFN